MAPARVSSNLLGLVDSDSEDDLGGHSTKGAATAAKAAKATKATRKTAKTTSKAGKTAASIRDMPAATRRGRPSAASTTKAATASKVTKKATTTAATRRAEQRRASAAAAAAEAAEQEDEAETSTVSTTKGRGRKALSDRTNEQQTAEAEPATKGKGKGKARRPGRKAAAQPEEEAEEKEEEPAVEEPATKRRGRGRPKAASKEEEEPKKATAPRRRGRAAPALAEEDESSMAVDDNEDQEKEDEDSKKTGPEIPETQFVDSMEVDNDDNDDLTEDVSIAASVPQVPSPAVQRRAKTQPPSSATKRPRTAAATSSSSEDTIAMRRRLGDLTKKYDALEARHRDLREIGIKDAEKNFDRLQKESDDRDMASNDLIASLKAEVATYRALAQDGERAQKACDASETRAAALQAQVEKLTASLGEAKAESKALSTKVAALRTVTEQAPAIVPGSARKSGPAATSAAAAAAAAASASSVSAQLKEDLYGDLTGLLVRTAKRDGSGELYDCIQTGRNGSLHFKLTIENNKPDADYDDEAQFVYTPQLDASRDAVLISRLPDYLVEEISFPRVQAAKFYKRVMQSLAEEV